MAKYLVNTTLSTYLFKAGHLEIEPRKIKAVTDSDFASGMFDDAILRGALVAYDNESDIPSVQGSVPESAKVETVLKASDQGASMDELKAHLAAIEEKKAAEANKYKVEPEPIEVLEPVEETVKIEEVKVKAKPGRKPVTDTPAE